MGSIPEFPAACADDRQFCVYLLDLPHRIQARVFPDDMTTVHEATALAVICVRLHFIHDWILSRICD
jgi:hypothetical protein